MQVFPVRYKSEFDSIICHVFPSKQKDIVNVITALMASDIKHEAILFGSSTTRRCNAYSDIDIAIKTNELNDDDFIKLYRTIKSHISGNTDIIYLNSTHSEQLKKEIEKGLTIWKNY